MTNKQYRKLRDTVTEPVIIADEHNRFLRQLHRYPRGRDYNRVKGHVPRDPDIIMYHNMPARTAPPTVETRILGEALLIAHAMCREGLLNVAKTRTHSYWAEEEIESVFEENDDLMDGSLPSMSEEEIELLYLRAMHEVDQYNTDFGGIDYWSPVTRKWHVRKAQLGDEVQIYRGSSDDPTDFYGEEPKDPNERQDDANHKWDDRFNRMEDWEAGLVDEEYFDIDPWTGRQVVCSDRPFGRWVPVEGKDGKPIPNANGKIVFRFKPRPEFYEEREKYARLERRRHERIGIR